MKSSEMYREISTATGRGVSGCASRNILSQHYSRDAPLNGPAGLSVTGQVPSRANPLPAVCQSFRSSADVKRRCLKIHVTLVSTVLVSVSASAR